MKMPGVVDVLTGRQIVDDKIGNLICGWMIHSKDGSPMKMGAWPAMAPDTVRFVGQAVAVVIAETRNQARDAAEAVVVDYEELPAVVDMLDAVASGAPQLHPEAPNNVDLRLDHRGRGRHGGGIQERCPRDRARHHQQPAGAEPDGAARGDRRLRRGGGTFHALHHLAKPACRAAGAFGVLQRRPGTQIAGDRAGCRRRLRLQDLHLSGRNGGALGLQAHRPAGEVDQRPDRGLPHRRPRPRSSDQGRDRL